MERRTFLLGAGAGLFLAATRHARPQQQTSLLVLHDGRAIQQDNPDTPFDLASGTKSFAGTLTVLLGLPLDEPLSKILTEWKDDPARQAITLRQLLTLTSGLDPGRIGRPPTYADALKMPVQAPKFRYGPAPYQVFGEYLKRQTGVSNPLELYAKHLAIPTQRWKIGPDGNPHLPSGAKLTASEWAAFGQFVLDHWNKLGPCFQGTEYNPCYGLTWWLNRECPRELRVSTPPMNREIDDLYTIPEIPKDLVYAGGAGGQRLFLSPSKKLIVVRQIQLTLRSMRKRNYSDAQLLKDVLARIA